MTVTETSTEKAAPLRPTLFRHALDSIFNPRSVAVIGATETAGAVGRTVCRNLISNPFGGTVFPVNPKRHNVLGVKAYPNVAALPEKVDLAVIATPAPTVPDIIGECVKAGIPGAIIISAGFKELGPQGAELERQIQQRIANSSMRIIGPNCLGVMNPRSGFNATFAPSIAAPGNVAFLSQSGALCTAVLDWSHRELVGFSAFISTGSMLDVGWGDLIDYFGNDPHTHSILIYMESIGDARAFMSAAREVALTKPIILIKPGRTAAASKAAASHTGALTGSDEVLDAAFHRAGVLRVNNISDLFYMAEILARQPRPRGPHLTILTNAGGPGVLATDSIITAGGELTTLAPPTIEALNALLPPHWSRGNPIDVLGDAGPERYAKALEIAAKDPNTDGLLVILTPQDMTDPTGTAKALEPYAKLSHKPVLASWMGGPIISAGEEILNRAGIPTFPYPDTAAKAFHYMWQYSDNLRSIYETPVTPNLNPQPDKARATSIINAALKLRGGSPGLDAATKSETLLDEAASKQLLAAYGIPVVRTEVAATPQAAVDFANAIGFPVVLKLFSKTITHKTDVGGVKLNLKTPADVQTAFAQIQSAVAAGPGAEHFQGVTVQPMVRFADSYELILGSSIDPQFGPVLLFGTGGQLVEIFKDRALGLPPLNATLARRMMEGTKIYKALHGVRGRKPVDLHAVEAVVVRFSQLIAEQPRIKELDINPLVVSPAGIVALDARIVLFPLSVTDDQLPRLAIRPYPSQYITSCALDDGQHLTIRPIRPEDEPLLAQFHKTLSEDAVRLRYLHLMSFSQRITHARLSRVCFNDYDREIALVVELPASADAGAQILAVARLVRIPGTCDAEFAIIVSDRWQNRGLGAELLKQILDIARDEKVGGIRCDISTENLRMQQLAEKFGFTLAPPADGICSARRTITPA